MSVQLRFRWMVIVLALVTVVMVAGMNGLLMVTAVVSAGRNAVPISMPVAVVMNVAGVMLRFDFVHQNRCRSP